jgi:hypothetical protein
LTEISYFAIIHAYQTTKDPAMSKMSQLMIDIQYALEQGTEPVQIAADLEIPISWVFEAQKIAVDQ